MSVTPRIAVISPDKNLLAHLELRLQSRGYQVVPITSLSGVLGFLYSDPPDLILMNLCVKDAGVRQAVKELKADSYFSMIPVIGIIPQSTEEVSGWDKLPVDDFVVEPINYTELFSRISLALQRIQRIFDNNPLTRLPGNTSIQRAIDLALGKPMAVCYVDINYFKPYNDTYGFSRGDDVIRMVARIMSNVVREYSEGGFVGHVGGDDFVFVVPLEKAETICQTIIDNFSGVASDLFGEFEKKQGYYLAKDRSNQEQKIPLLALAIAIVPTNTPVMQHPGKVAEVAAELKKLAKKSARSSYVLERRRKPSS
ncbi:MAG: diguanylate cyclase [Nitrospirota bacterium]